MRANDWYDVAFNTAVGCVMSAVFMTVIWKLSGWWIRKRGVSPPDRREARRFLRLSFSAVVVLFATLPTVIEAYGNTYPISGETMGYFVCLFLASLMGVAYSFVSYRQQPSQQSAFIIGAGLAAVFVTMGIVALFAMAIAASAYT